MSRQDEGPGGDLPARLRSVVALLAGDGRRRARAAQDLGLEAGRRAVLADGPHLVREAVAAGCLVHALIGTDAALAGEASTEVRALAATGVPVYRVPARDLERLAPTRTPQGILAVVALAPAPTARSVHERVAAGAFVLALDGVQDPGNVGSLARSALAAGVAVLALGPGCARPDDAKTLRASQGALFRLPVWSGDLAALAAAVRAAGRSLVVAVPRGGEPAWRVDLGAAGLVMLGGEGHGVDPVHVCAADRLVTLPMAGGESLGVAAAGAVILYERVRQAGA